MQVPYEYIEKQVVTSGDSSHVFNFVPNYDCTGETLNVDVFKKGINKIKTVASGISGGKRYNPIVVTGDFSGISAESDYILKVVAADGSLKKTVAKGSLIIK